MKVSKNFQTTFYDVELSLCWGVFVADGFFPAGIFVGAFSHSSKCSIVINTVKSEVLIHDFESSLMFNF